MSWNYRVIKRTYPAQTVNGVDIAEKNTYEIHEAYYDDDGEIWSITEEVVGPYGETEKELADDVACYIKALVRPVLDFDGPFPGKNPGDEDDGEPVPWDDAKRALGISCE